MMNRFTKAALLLGMSTGAALLPPEIRAQSASGDLSPSVKVEREKPARDKKPTLRFLRENRDFLRAQLDRLRQVALQRDGEALPLSDRHLRFREMLEQILAAQDTVGIEQDRLDQMELLTSVRQIGDLESQLDLLEELLGEQRERLVELERDYVGRQQTALVVFLRGFPAGDGPEAVVLEQDDGSRVRVELDPSQREALRRGGIAQVFHEFVEPRAQAFTVKLEGAGWPATSTEVAVDPARGRLTFLQLELDRVEPGTTLANLRASTWTR